MHRVLYGQLATVFEKGLSLAGANACCCNIELVLSNIVWAGGDVTKRCDTYSARQRKRQNRVQSSACCGAAVVATTFPTVRLPNEAINNHAWRHKTAKHSVSALNRT